MLRKVLAAAVLAVTLTGMTAGVASAQMVGVSVGGFFPRPYYRTYATPVFVQPVVVQTSGVVQDPPVIPAPPVLQPPQVVQTPPIIQAPPPVVQVAPVVQLRFSSETFLTLRAARHFANAMSSQGYQIRVASHGLGWRVYYGLPVLR